MNLFDINMHIVNIARVNILQPHIPRALRCHVVCCRCGADCSLRNNENLTAEECLLKEKPDGWEENLHWFNKFKPGTCRPYTFVVS